MRRLLPALLLLVAGGCFPNPGRLHPVECTRDSDCSTGEACNQNLCFGDPPASVHFAAEIIPPPDRTDLAPLEISTLEIAQDGSTSGLSFAKPVTYSGRVVLVDKAPESIAAHLTFERASRVSGLDFSLTVDAKPGKKPGEIAFTAELPPNLPGESYHVTITPADDLVATGSVPPSSLAPPLRTTLTLTKDQKAVEIALADPDQVSLVTGTVVDAAQRALAGLVVRAWSDPGAVSSTGTTDAAGAFAILVPQADSVFDLVVSGAAGSHIPTLKRHGLDVGTYPSLDAGTISLPSFPNPIKFQLPVTGADSAGGTEPVVGAALTATTTITGGPDDVSYACTATTGSDGYGDLWLIPGSLDGNRQYDLRVVPLVDTRHAAVWSTELDVGPPNPSTGAGGVLPSAKLDDRIYVSGRILDADSTPVEGASIALDLSAFFTYTLSADERDEAAKVSLPSSTADSDGRFGVWVDTTALGMITYYDLVVDPPAGSLLPSWSTDRVILDGNSAAVDEGDLFLPKRSLAGGTVTDASGKPVPGAEVRVYVVNDDTSLCNTLPDPTSCVPPARLRAVSKTDDAGGLILVLPSP